MENIISSGNCMWPMIDTIYWRKCFKIHCSSISIERKQSFTHRIKRMDVEILKRFEKNEPLNRLRHQFKVRKITQTSCNNFIFLDFNPCWIINECATMQRWEYKAAWRDVLHEGDPIYARRYREGVRKTALFSSEEAEQMEILILELWHKSENLMRQWRIDQGHERGRCSTV